LVGPRRPRVRARVGPDEHPRGSRVVDAKLVPRS
jgi:hypothetical protein